MPGFEPHYWHELFFSGHYQKSEVASKIIFNGQSEIPLILKDLFIYLFKTLQCTYVAISYIQTSTMIKFTSCTDGPQATGPVANVMYII